MVSWGKQVGDEIEDGGVGDADGLVVDMDVDWGFVGGGGGEEAGEGRGDFPGGVFGEAG